MKKVLTGRDVEALIRRGRGLESIPEGILLTPTAKDAIKAAQARHKRGITSGEVTGGVTEEPMVPDYEFRWEPGRSEEHTSELQTQA